MLLLGDQTGLMKLKVIVVIVARGNYLTAKYTP